MKANTAEVVACEPNKKSWVVFKANIAPEPVVKGEVPPPVEQDPHDAVAPPSKHCELVPFEPFAERAAVMVKLAPVSAEFPADPIVPVVTILSAPVSIDPNPEVIDPALRAPTVVREEVTTPVPSVVLDKTLVPLIR